MKLLKYWKKFVEFVRQVRNIAARRFPKTEYHKKAWLEYEQFLMYRANGSQFMSICYFLYYVSNGQENFQSA